jgi:hypothetical protein
MVVSVHIWSWRALEARDWARLAVERVRYGQKSFLTWEGAAAGCFLFICWARLGEDPTPFLQILKDKGRG